VPFDGAYRTAGGGTSLRGLAGLRHQIAVGRGKLEQRVYGQMRHLDMLENFTGWLQDPVVGDRRLQVHRFLSAGYQVEYTRPLVDSLVLVAGGAWQGDRVRQQDSRVDEQHGVVARNWDLGVGQHQAHVRLGLRWRPTKWLYVEGGARADLFAYDVIDGLDANKRTRKVLGLPSPRLLTAFRVSERWSLFASYGRGLRAPEARSILGGKLTASDVELSRYKGGTPRVFPSDAVEVGGRYAGRRFAAGLALFGTWIDRELVFDHVSAVNLELNRTRRLGVELDLTARPLDWLELRQDLTLTHARFVQSGAPVPLAPPVLSATTMTLVHPRGYRAGARLQVVGPRALPHGARSSAYALLDLSVGYRAGPLQLDLQLDNVTNARWKEGEYHYASWWDKDDPRSTIPSLHFIAGPPLTVRAATTLWF
jgi:outer membrane receptor protein involved in Fe transport